MHVAIPTIAMCTWAPIMPPRYGCSPFFLAPVFTHNKFKLTCTNAQELKPYTICTETRASHNLQVL